MNQLCCTKSVQRGTIIIQNVYCINTYSSTLFSFSGHVVCIQIIKKQSITRFFYIIPSFHTLPSCWSEEANKWQLLKLKWSRLSVCPAPFSCQCSQGKTRLCSSINSQRVSVWGETPLQLLLQPRVTERPLICGYTGWKCLTQSNPWPPSSLRTSCPLRTAQDLMENAVWGRWRGVHSGEKSVCQSSFALRRQLLESRQVSSCWLVMDRSL